MGERRVGWGFWIAWVVVSAIGWAISGYVWLFVIWFDIAWSQPVVMVAIPTLTCAVHGLTQWLVLRPRLPKAGWWIVATPLGWLASFALLGVVSRAQEDIDFGFLQLWSGAIAGGVSGVVQWLVLQRRVRQAGWWILASIVAFALGWSMFSSFGATSWFLPEAIWKLVHGFNETLVAAAVVLAIAGGIVGVITGGVLVWLLRQPVTTTDGE